jgi:hypothetical protein
MKQTGTFFMIGMAASTLGGRLPDLYPPGGYIEPSFWEKYHWHCCGGAVLGVATIFLLWRLFRCPVATQPVPPDVAARRSLEALGLRPEDGILAGAVSRIMRDYLPSATALPRQELTADEVEWFFRTDKQAGDDLRAGVVQLLRDCDTLKYGASVVKPVNLVSRALAILEGMETAKRKQAELVALEKAGNSSNVKTA